MQTIIVDMTPGFRMPTIYYSQGDVGTQFAIDLRSRFGDSFPTGTTVTIQATKPSGFGFSVAATSVTNGVATFTTTAEMTDEFGRFPAELKVTKTGLTLFTANFYMDGERNTHPEGTTDGSQETVIPELTQLVERVEDAASSVLDMTVVANTLPAGSDATYSYDEETNTATFGIPKGADGSLASGVLAPTYSSSSTYAVGDYVYYSGSLYRCTTAITTAEAWTSGHWTQVALAPEVSDLKSEINGVASNGVLYAPYQQILNKGFNTSTGATPYEANWDNTSFIPVTEGEIIHISNGKSTKYNGFYESDHTFIGSFTVPASSDFSCVVPADAAYMILSNKHSNFDFKVWRELSNIAKDKDFTYVVGKSNLLQDVPWIGGAYISESGVITSYETSAYSNLIPVNGSELVYSYLASSSSGNMRIHGYDENGSWVAQIDRVTTGSIVTVKEVSIETVGYSYIRISEQADITPLALVENGSISNNIFSLNNLVQNNTKNIGAYEKSFTLTAGQGHSSDNDRVAVDIEQGDRFLVLSTIDANISFSTQWWAKYDDDTYENLGTVTVGTQQSFVASKNIVSLGLYIGAQESGGIVTMIVKTAIAYDVDLGVSETDILHNAFNSAYTKAAITQKIKDYCDLFVGSEDVEPFLFFTDPHYFLSGDHFGDGSMNNLYKYMPIIQKAYNSTPVSFCLCGGDWLNNSDTAAEACEKLGYIDGLTRDFFRVYYPMLGNHDNNYQGVDDGVIPKTLSNATMRNLMFREFDANYYSFKTAMSRFYIFDTGSDWDTSMTAYRWAQVDWFANLLSEHDDAHAVIGLHIVTNQTKTAFDDSPTIQLLADNVTKVAQAYNNRTTITLNGISYDFSAKTGKVEFMIAGHTHWDGTAIVNSIPTLITREAFAGGTATFDLVFADYTNREVNAVRIGTGNDRSMSLT